MHRTLLRVAAPTALRDGAETLGGIASDSHNLHSVTPHLSANLGCNLTRETAPRHLHEAGFTTHTCMQGMCDSTAPVETEQPLPSARACVLDVHEDFLEASNATRALLLSHLYVRLRDTGGRSTATLILNKARALWLSHVALQGNVNAVRGMDIYENSRVYIAGVCLLVPPPSAVARPLFVRHSPQRPETALRTSDLSFTSFAHLRALPVGCRLEKHLTVPEKQELISATPQPHLSNAVR